MKVLALAGGVGGAKLCLGLAKVLEPDELQIVVNTGDDEEFYGLLVSPDLDTVMYTLAGMANPDTGWGIRGDTFDTLSSLGGWGKTPGSGSETATWRRTLSGRTCCGGAGRSLT